MQQTVARAAWWVLAGLFVALFAVACAPATRGEALGASIPGGSPAQVAAVAADPAPGRDEGAPGPVPVGLDDPSWGSRTALVTIVEFADFQCPFSRKVATTLVALQKRYGPDELRIVWKNNPLSFHPLARGAHEMAVAAFEKRGNVGFWAFYETVYFSDRQFTDELYKDALRNAGLSPADVEAARVRSSAKIDGDQDLGKRRGMTGTPTFLVNGVAIRGAQSIDKFVEVIDAELGEAKALLAAGVPRGRIYAERTAKNIGEAPPPAPATQKNDDDRVVWKVPIGTSPVRGKPTALVTIVEFGDYECPFCGRVQKTINDLLAQYKDQVRLVYKDNPLPFHKHAEPASEVALEVRAKRGDAAFWQLHDALYADKQHLEGQDLAAAAARVGLPSAAALSAIASMRHAATIEADVDLAEDLEARGTPSFFINGRKLVGAQPIEKFRAIIDEELAGAQELLKRGVPAARVYETLQQTARGAAGPETISLPAPTAQNPSRGPANAKVVIQYFSDYQCPFCRKVEGTLAELEKAFPGQIRVVFRNNPLGMHEYAPLAAEAALEGYRQKGAAGFWAMHAELFSDQTTLDRKGLERVAAKVGLDVAAFNASLDKRSHQAEVEADARLAAAAKISGTPAFSINGYYLGGAQPLSKFKKLVRLALAQQKAP